MLIIMNDFKNMTSWYRK